MNAVQSVITEAKALGVWQAEKRLTSDRFFR